MEESAHGLPGAFIGVGGPGRQLVRRAVDVRVLVAVEVRKPPDDTLGFLGGGSIIEPDEWPAVDRFLEDREVSPDRGRIEGPPLAEAVREFRR